MEQPDGVLGSLLSAARTLASPLVAPAQFLPAYYEELSFSPESISVEMLGGSIP